MARSLPSARNRSMYPAYWLVPLAREAVHVADDVLGAPRLAQLRAVGGRVLDDVVQRRQRSGTRRPSSDRLRARGGSGSPLRPCPAACCALRARVSRPAPPVSGRSSLRSYSLLARLGRQWRRSARTAASADSRAAAPRARARISASTNRGRRRRSSRPSRPALRRARRCAPARSRGTARRPEAGRLASRPAVTLDCHRSRCRRSAAPVACSVGSAGSRRRQRAQPASHSFDAVCSIPRSSPVRLRGPAAHCSGGSVRVRAPRCPAGLASSARSRRVRVHARR